MDFRLQATAAESADNPAVLKEQRLGAQALRAGAFDARDEGQREGLVGLKRGDELLVKVLHTLWQTN